MDISNAYQIITDKLLKWAHDLVRLLPNILLSAIILVLGIYIAGWLKRLAAKLFSRISHHAALNNLFTSVIYVFFIGVTLFTVLSILQLNKAVTSILAGAGILGLALAFAFQDIASNFISGIFISFRSPINIGDVVKIKDYMGKVQDINLRETIIQTFQGQMVIIPNKEVYQNPIENFSLLGKRRVDLSIGVSYGDDLEKAKEIAINAVKDIKNRSEDEITLFYQEFGGSSINYSLRIWINTPEQPAFLEAASEAVMRIKKAYDANDITLPFPITTLDFGIKGGVSLREITTKDEPTNNKGPLL